MLRFLELVLTMPAGGAGFETCCGQWPAPTRPACSGWAISLLRLRLSCFGGGPALLNILREAPCNARRAGGGGAGRRRAWMKQRRSLQHPRLHQGRRFTSVSAGWPCAQ